MRFGKLAIGLSIVVVSFAAHAAPVTGPTADTKAVVAPTPTIEWFASSLNCETGEFQIQARITNPTTKEIAGKLSIDGSKGDGVSFTVPAGQHRAAQVVTPNGHAKCDGPAKIVTGRITGTGFPVARTETFKPRSVLYLYDAPKPSSTTNTIYVTKLQGTTTFCGQAAKFNVNAKNTMPEPTDVKVRLKFGLFDKTVTQRVHVSNEDAFLFPTTEILDCAGKGAPSVRYELLSGPGGAATVTPRTLSYSPN